VFALSTAQGRIEITERGSMRTTQLREQLQENLRAYLSGMPGQFVDEVCQIVVDTFDDELRAKYSVPPEWTGTKQLSLGS
jgi:hypothetical protein